MLRSLALVPLLCSVAYAAQPAGTTPLLLQVGGDYLGADLRQALETDWGYHAGLATLVAESGMVGVPSVDLDFRYAPDGEGSLFTFAATYAERALIGGRYWVGAGFGSNFVRLKLDQTAERGADSERRWTLGGKAMLGYLLTDRMFVEVTYHYTREALDLDTASASVALGYWF
jgi:hypothetical protein